MTGEKYATSAEIPFERVHELFAYRDAQAERAWDADSPDSPANSMIYLILLPPSVTVVLDDPVHPEIQAILDSMRDPLRVRVGQWKPAQSILGKRMNVADGNTLARITNRPCCSAQGCRGI